MDFGASTLFFREHPVTEALKLIARAGYEAAEVWIEHLWWSGQKPAQVARLARSLNLQLSVHAAAYDLNPTSVNVGIREESLQQVALSIAIAAEMGARVIVVHPGRLSSSQDRAEDFWDRLFHCAEQIDHWAIRHEMKVGLELMERRPKEFFTMPEDGARLMSHPWTHLGLTVDIAHLHTLGDPVKLLQHIDPAWIAHVHLSDGLPDQTHTPLGEGTIDLAATLSALAGQYNGLVNLEGVVPGCGAKTIRANLAHLRHLGFA